MKVIGFVGSPRAAGNTAWMVSEILEGARERGAETGLFHSGALNIEPCRGCLGCVNSDRCVINDDMRELYSKLRSADALVLGSPIYMGQMSAQAKVFTDRLFAQISPRFSPHYREGNAGKRLVLAFTQGNPDIARFRPYYDYTRSMFGLLEFVVGEVVVIPNTRSVPASEREGEPGRMREVGASLCLDIQAAG